MSKNAACPFPRTIYRTFGASRGFAQFGPLHVLVDSRYVAAVRKYLQAGDHSPNLGLGSLCP